MIGGRRHPGERELLDGYYADAGEATRAVRDHLSHCPRCAGAYAALAGHLDRLASLGRLEGAPSEPPGSWDAQVARIHGRLGAVVGPDGAARARTGDILPRRGLPRRWSLAAALGTAAAVALVAWAPWGPSTPPALTTALQQDQVDDQLLQDIEALLEGPLASLGWPGAAVPTLTAL
jgi:ribosomal protein S27AE